MRMTHLLIAALIVALLPTVAGASLPNARVLAAPDPDQINFTLEGCRLGTFDPGTVTCDDADYTTGNLGKSWNELDLVPHRVTLTNNDGDQTYSFIVSGDHTATAGGPVGWDVVSALTLNTALSDASCTAATMGPQMITPSGGGAGGADQTIYRLVTITQQADATCVYDYYQRLAVGASQFSGSSLQSNLWNQSLTASGIGEKKVSLPVNEIAPQELNKDMSATQDATHIWNITKAPTPAQLQFTNTCGTDPSARQQGVSITVEWEKLPATPSGAITVVTNIYATNPAARTITVNVTDEIRTGTTVLDPANSGDVDIPANTTLLVLTHQATVPSGTTDLNDVATASYIDKLTGVPIPGQTQATASADVQPSGVTQNASAVINDIESITGASLQYSADSFSGASGAFDGGYLAGTKTTGTVSWTSVSQNGSGSVTFDKTVYVTGPAISSGTLADTATLTGSDGFTTDAEADVTISANALVTLTIRKTIPDVLQGGETASFTFNISGPDSYAHSVTIDFAAGETSKSSTVEGLMPGQYTVSEVPPTGWAAQPDQTVNIGLPACTGRVSFGNSVPPAKAKVKKVTVPAGSEASWELLSISCDDSDSKGILDQKKARFEVAAGETVTCTFYNKKKEAPRPDPLISVDYTANPVMLDEPGGEVAFRVLVKNEGQLAVTLNSLVDNIFGDLTNSAAGANAVLDTTCKLPQTIGAGGSYQCTYTDIVVGAPGYVENHTLTASAADDVGKKAQASDNASVTIGNTPSRLEVSVVAAPASVFAPGGQVLFTVVVRNTSVADQVTVSSLVDEKNTNLSSTCAASLPVALAPGQSTTCSWNEQVTGNAGSVFVKLVTASGIDDDGAAVSDQGSDDVEIKTTPVEPSFAIYLPLVMN